MRLGVSAALVGDALVPGDVLVADGLVQAVGVAPAGAGGIALAGFVDLQVNGFGGVDFLTAGGEEIACAEVALAATGVTAYQPTLISAPEAELARALAVLGAVPAVAPGARRLGAHLEGPFLSPRWPGAHPREHLRAPDGALVARLLAGGPVAMVTLAPELPGGLELVRSLSARGVIVSIGHSDADTATVHAAFDAGARGLTHVHNAHRRFAPREPGPAGVALIRPGVGVMAILDGVHLAPETAAAAWLTARERLCLVTDAIAAAGTTHEGPTHLGRCAVTVAEGAARLADGTLAGGLGTMDRALRELMALGATLAQAGHAAARAPALLAGRPELGQIAPGAPADLVVVDEGLRVRRTVVAGREAFAG